jgi:protoporphyrinogen/coproporphyrinogen III oxidase
MKSQTPSTAKVSRVVTVVGAGFSGLTAAYYLKRAGFQVEIFEKKSQAGGLISTVKTPFGPVETAANGLLNSSDVEDLFADLDLEIEPALKSSRHRFIFRNGRPRRWPVGLTGTFSVAKFLVKYFFARSSVAPQPQETVRNWGFRVLGRDVTESLVEAGIQGIYAGDSSRMSATLIVGGLFKKRGRRRAPKIKGTVAPAGGMGLLIARLRSHLEESGVRFHLDEKYVLAQTNSHPIVVATSSRAAADLLKPVDPDRALLLEAIETLPLVSATFFFSGSVSPKYAGFGCLFPPIEKRPMLGVLMNTFIFSNRSQNAFSETWIFGGASDLSVNSKSVAEITEIIQIEREKTFGGTRDIVHAEINRWPEALPHYTVELEKNLPILQKEKFNLFLIGNYLGEIGLTKILARAQALADEVAEKGRWNA